MNGFTVEQVNIRKAEKLFNGGQTIFIHPCNMRVNNAYQRPMQIALLDPVNIGCDDITNSFKCIVNEFTYYNCDNERGNYPIFFAERK